MLQRYLSVPAPVRGIRASALGQVNHAPSFGADSSLDQRVKEQVLQDTFAMLGLTAERKKTFKKESRKFAALRQLSGAAKKRAQRGRMDVRELREIVRRGPRSGGGSA